MSTFNVQGHNLKETYVIVDVFFLNLFTIIFNNNTIYYLGASKSTCSLAWKIPVIFIFICTAQSHRKKTRIFALE